MIGAPAILASDPCDETSSITNWAGNVTVAKTSKQVNGIKVTWSGPFACSGNPNACFGFTTGTYEEDAMVTGRKAPKQTAGKYKDEQQVMGCVPSGCGTLAIIGLSVGP